MFILVTVACYVVAALDAYQAITGNRLSKRPSRRTDAQMRRQSAIAAIGLTVLATAALAYQLSK